ncbi:1-deoxy-D-xylulose-5-phosphate synthase [Amycolatopsis thailandensis]|uniref:1-deoxy-D-xylulose-5-phosphate synthase n=1 Tax=Amycolatopsis thailandensis TaxID=589330 RepID=A0A229S2S1_9PSEU|nr:1-deoxy-D-xylulose-5-phosphate synthase [Amycolatopsis thailandensis]OXM53223.1 1-deoxy-D-xylulose-5-phosphate synthase [Amycolatopsis thailandensis]
MTRSFPGLSELKELGHDRLSKLAEEIRTFLVREVSRTGGHLGPNLGVVELTLAVHRVFDSPKDKIVFDTGHQSYVHKILTGRAVDFGTLRKAGGIAGYPQNYESVHDLVENSHASTALSYVDGLAKSFRLRGENDRTAVAVVGDGALTGGLAWEALNNLGAGGSPVVVVLNDNGRSYAPTAGGLADHLAALRSGEGTGTTLFELLGLGYLGPVDGHDTAAVEEALREAASRREPTVVHCVTEKGHGYVHAENDEADRMHAVGAMDPETGEQKPGSGRSWTSLFGDVIAEIGAEHEDVVAMTAAMLLPVGLGRFAREFPERVIDVGISEQHAVTSAAGLAMGGSHPVVCVYATFFNRAFDQALMDVALHGLPVTFVLDRAGVTGPDGPSHHGMWDLALLGRIPGMRVAAPRDADQLSLLLREAVAVSTGPTAVRFPKATAGPAIPAMQRMDGVDLLRRSPGMPLDVLIVAAGVTATAALEAAELLESEGLGVTVVDPRWILPVNPVLVHFAARHRLVVTVEDGVRAGGMGSALREAVSDTRVTTPVVTLGLPKSFLAHGDRATILRACGLDGPSIARVASASIPALPEGAPTSAEATR